jgi:hypothetical protein
MNAHAVAGTAALLLLFACGNEDALMYSLPPNALEARHIKLSDTGDEQDYFFVEEAYPSTRVLDHYRTLFAGWTECTGPNPEWESFADSATGKLRYVRQLPRWWINAEGDTIVMVALLYESGDGISPEQAARQKVIVLRHKSTGAKNLAVQHLSLRCET